MGFFSRFFKSDTKSKVDNELAFLEVDMHNHILPRIDDGSSSIEQSIMLLDGLANLGLTKFVCTPHIMKDVYNNDFTSISSAHTRLTDKLYSVTDQFKIEMAAEHMIDDGISYLINSDGLMVIPGGYVLIEMSYLAESKSLFHVILDIQNKGLKPILAHPERYNYYHAKREMFTQIKNAGCLLQLNLLSLSNYYGSGVNDTAMDLLKMGMYDFVGTDLHHERHLEALNSLVNKYPVRDLLKNSPIKNETLLDHLS